MRQKSESVSDIERSSATVDRRSARSRQVRSGERERTDVDYRFPRRERVPVGRQSGERNRAAAALTNTNELILFQAVDGTIEWASPACTHLLGVRPGDLVGRYGVDLIHPDDRATAVAAFRSIPNTGDRVRIDFRVFGADGQIRWIEEIATNLLDDPAVGCIIGNLHDVTERVVLLERVERDRRRLADAQSAARIGSFEIDLATGDISRSDELCRILGVPISVGSKALDVVHPDDRDALKSMLDQAIAGREPCELEYRIIRPTGEVRWVRTQGDTLVKPSTHVVAGTVLDITERHDADEALAFQATHDWLTGLPNPASLHASLQRSLATVGLDDHVMVAVIGIDNFRQIYDSRGSAAGDEALRSLAARLRAETEPGDLVGRLRHDEFIVARHAAVRASNACEFGRTLKDLLSGSPSDDGDDISHPRRSFSVGVTTSTADDSPESMLVDADAAMQEAKRDGGDRVVVLDDSARARVCRRRRIIAALPLALARNEFRLEYQPVVHLASLRTVGFEALLRWTHPDLGSISPTEFIPIAESHRLVVPIGSWVIDTALQQLADWRLDPCVPADLWMSINLSAQQLSQAHLPSRVSHAIERLGIPPELVHLEITESVLMDRIDHGRQTIADLHSLGVKISIDDFGTGYSSLSYLSRLTVDTIKIDRSFVSALNAARDSTSIIRAIITLANSLELATVAEGIESTRQLDTLRALGCTNGQGFLWSRALHPADALQWVRDSERLSVSEGPARQDPLHQPEQCEIGTAIVQIAIGSGKRRCGPRDLRDLLRFDTLDIGLHARKAWIAGRDLRLTAKEFELLAYLATHPNETFTREELLHHVWHSSRAWQNEATVTEHIYRLRNHIEPDPARPLRIRTERGHGYRFVS